MEVPDANFYYRYLVAFLAALVLWGKPRVANLAVIRCALSLPRASYYRYV